LEHTLRGNSITLIERRPPWSELVGPEWSSMKIAQLRYDAKARVWSLYTCDSIDRWWPYDFIGARVERRPIAGRDRRRPEQHLLGLSARSRSRSLLDDDAIPKTQAQSS
jgi:Protein of unknown function (DUF3024)